MENIQSENSSQSAQQIKTTPLWLKVAIIASSIPPIVYLVGLFDPFGVLYRGYLIWRPWLFSEKITGWSGWRTAQFPASLFLWLAAEILWFTIGALIGAHLKLVRNKIAQHSQRALLIISLAYGIPVMILLLLVNTVGPAIASSNSTLKCRLVFDGPDIKNKSQCLSDIAVYKNSPELCDTITDTVTKGRCLARIAAKVTDESTCLRIAELDYKSSCYFSLAKRTGQISFCNFVTGQVTTGSGYSNKDLCYQDLAWSNKDSSICEKIQLAESRDNCLSKVAGQNTKGPGVICEKIKEVSSQNECFLNTAVLSGQPEICYKISPTTNGWLDRNFCLYSIAEYIIDPSLCNTFFKDLYLRATCTSRVNAEIARRQR